MAKDKNTPKTGLEYRYAERSAPKLAGGKLSGRAAPFNTVAMIGKKPWGFREQIAPGAFANSVLEGDIVLLDQHDTAKPISRQSAGTLSLTETRSNDSDNGGLDWDAKPANTSYANDAVENARAGNYGGCSFGFEVVRDSWHYNKDDDVDERTLHEVKLHEISLVTFPAYTEGTSVSARDQVDAAMEARDLYYSREYLELYVVNGVDADESRGDGKKPYGDVTYADPGYQKDGKKRYPIDTKAHCKSAWDYINKSSNAAAYSAKQLAAVKSKIKSACKKFGIKVAGDAQKNNAEPEVEAAVRDETTGSTSVKLKGSGKVLAAITDVAFDEARSAEPGTLLAEIRKLILEDLRKRAVAAADKKSDKRKNKVGTSADNDADEDDPVCGACMGSGKGQDGSECAGGCAGSGRVAGTGDLADGEDGPGSGAGDMDGGGGDAGLGLGEDDGANAGPNIPMDGTHSADDPEEVRTEENSDEETRTDESESDSARDTDAADAARRMKAAARRARAAQEAREAEDEARRGSSGNDSK